MRKWIGLFLALSVTFWLFVGYGVGQDVLSLSFIVTLLLFVTSILSMIVAIITGKCGDPMNRHWLDLKVIPLKARLWGGMILFISYLGYAWIKVISLAPVFSRKYILLIIATLIMLVLICFLVFGTRKIPDGKA